MSTYIPIQSNLETSEIEHLGGKGLGLLKLVRSGAKVPITACIPSEKEAEKALEEILDYFSDRAGEKHYAVRSSGSIEDGKVKSCAGQFVSFLRVSGRDNLLEAITKCRNSAFSPALKEYYGNTPEDIKVNVLIQEMVEADFAGVLFTCDPVNGSRNHIILEAVKGTSENLLGGTETGERYVTDRQGNIIDGNNSFHPDKSIFQKVVREALEIEEKLDGTDTKGPLDFEWAVKDGEIFWLQVRPVTVFGKTKNHKEEILFIKPGEKPEVKEGEVFWTSMNAQEALPGVVTYLSEDLIFSMLNPAFVKVFTLMGVKIDKPEELEFLKLFNRRAFLSVTIMKNLFGLLPVKNPDEVVEELLTGKTAAGPKLKFSLSLILPAIKLLWRDFTLGVAYKNYLKYEMTQWTYPEREFLKNMTGEELAEILEKSLDINKGFTLHATGTMKYAGCFSLIYELCKKYDEQPASLIQGLGTLRFASASAALRDVASSLQKIKDILFDEDWNLKEDWQEKMKEKRLTEFRKVFYDFIEEYGHLGNGSVDFYNPNWREEPERILKIAGNILRSGDFTDCRTYLENLAEKRKEAIKKIYGKLSLTDKIKFPVLLKLMHRAAPYRENIKFLAHRRIAIAREYFKEAGRRFSEKNIILSEGDVFFMKKKEITEGLTHKNPPSLISQIQERKKEFQQMSLLPCPLHRVEGPSGVRLYFASIEKETKEFRGTPGSAGTFIGKARVIRVFSEAERLQPGEILVTINTDPSWTPLFSIAGAIVVEVGSMLSHGAVVAREAGIPAVLGIPGIVSFIKDGYTLIVDGTEGKVIISENL